MNARLRSLLGVVSVGALAVLGLACGSAPTDGDDTVSSSSEEALKAHSVTDGTFTGTDGKAVHYRTYDYNKAKAIVVFLNGRGEFVDKYDVLFSAEHEYPVGKVPGAETLANLPVSFVAIDHEGQGDSKAGRIPGHVDNFEYFVNDIHTLFTTLPKLAEHKLPIFMVSHSMGGLIAARYAQTFPGTIDGLVLSSPMLKHLAPAPLSYEQLMKIAGFYALPTSMGGQGMDKLCTEPKLPNGTKVDATALAAIAAVHSDATLKSCFDNPSGPMCPYITQCVLYGYPNNCGLPAIDFAGLNGLFQYLQYLNAYAPGCQPDDVTAASFDPCPDPVLTTDEGYCDYYYHNPKRAPASTFGWLFSSFMSQMYYAQTPVNVNVPVLLMTNGNDGIVDSSAHVCAGPIAGDCEVATFPGFGHELLSSADRREPIAKIREFISAHIGE